ncbi:GNAT family N-acetyltransferase [Mucilaginibacter agri]|uniref:GNAT family N-acetyltransferase n=1 Tax=Mucilaginibacter agri TaxID=2695265 RepID=UPI001AA13B98|nr:GNAT family N-acetyltransferase [Mucilaginibacter agri]
MRKIRKCEESDLITICKIINDGATAYQGKIPEVFTNKVYMDMKHLKSDIQAGVTFWALEDDDGIKGVMGLQNILDVMLIRHAYVRTDSQGEGIGSALLTYLLALISGRILVGTWAAAH